MKKIVSLIFLLLAGCVLHAQVNLQITNVSGIPFPPVDTAYEAGFYNVQISLLNTDTADFNDSLGIDILLQSNFNAVDTLYTDTLPHFLGAQGSEILTRNNYQLRPQNYDDGDNIVVVWPVARLTGQSGDSTAMHIYFISMNASVPELGKQIIRLYPNPVSGYIALGNQEGISIKQVRITDILGQEIYKNNLSNTLIPTDNWTPGIYFFEILKGDGSSQTIRIVKQ